MAFAFFRRRQKMVIIIMAALMVSFLIGFQGFQMLFSKSGGKQPIGETPFGTITLADLNVASDQLDILNQYAYMGIFPRFMEEHFAYRVLMSNVDQDGRSEAPLVYAMLLQEAAERGGDVSEGDVDKFFARLPYPYLPVEDYKDLVEKMNTRGKITEKQLRGTVAGWIRVYRLYEDSCPSTPPSDPKLRRVYRRLNEKIALQIVKFSAEDLTKGVAEPTAEQIAKQFTEYRGKLEGSYPDETSFGFGYFQLPRVRISWFLARPNVVGRVISVSDEDVQRHYRRNKSRYVKEVPVEAAATEGDDEAASRPVEYKTVPMDINEAWNDIVIELKPSVVAGKINKILISAEKKAVTSGKDAGGVYEQVLKNMRKDKAAAEVLDKRIELMSVKNATLEEAVKILADKVDLAGICFPWGKHGGMTIDPKMKISFTAKGTLLRDVLKDITRQAFSQAKDGDSEAPAEVPELQWTMVKGFDGVLFPLDTEDIKMFPVAAATTTLLTGSEIWQDEVLGLCGDPNKEGQFLAPLALSRDALEAAQSSGTYVGPRMQTLSDEQLMWRIIEVKPAHSPAAMTEEIKDKVIEDLKLAAGYQVAMEKAQEFEKLAATTGLEDAARKAKLEGLKAELFPRLGQGGWSDIEHLELPNRAAVAKRKLIEQVFKLIPENIEPPYSNTPPAMTVLYIPALRATAVVQRVDYEPAYDDKYQAAREDLAKELMRATRGSTVQYWFNKATMVERLNYEPESK